VVEHQWHDANNLGDQKQPEEPRAKAALRVQRSQWPPLDLNVPIKLGTLSCVAKPAWYVLFASVASRSQSVLVSKVSKCLLLALLGPREMSDLSPQSGPKRT
jgi:hypothetical protein